MKKISDAIMKSEMVDLSIELKIARQSDNEIDFLIDFINGSSEDIDLPFSENMDEAARLSLCLYFQGQILEPAEYRQAIRNVSELPSVIIKAGERHSFVMNGTLENKLLKFGRTSYIVNPGSYQVRFVYDGMESNEVEWNVGRGQEGSQP